MRKDESMNELKESGEISQVSAENQPPAELKRLGWVRKKLLREVLGCRIGGANKWEVAKLAKLFELTPRQLTIELTMNLAQIDKAIMGDTSAYKAVMGRAYGQPVAPPLPVNTDPAKIEIVYGDKPIPVKSE